MGTTKNKKTILDVIDRLELGLLNSNSVYARQYLIEEGMDVQKIEEHAAQYVKKIRFLSNASINKEKELNLIERALESVKRVIAENANESSESLRRILQQRAPSVQFRKLENWTDDEIRNILEDVDLVKVMEELDN